MKLTAVDLVICHQQFSHMNSGHSLESQVWTVSGCVLSHNKRPSEPDAFSSYRGVVLWKSVTQTCSIHTRAQSDLTQTFYFGHLYSHLTLLQVMSGWVQVCSARLKTATETKWVSAPPPNISIPQNPCHSRSALLSHRDISDLMMVLDGNYTKVIFRGTWRCVRDFMTISRIVAETFYPKQLLWHQRKTENLLEKLEEKIKRSPKSVGFIFSGPWMSS